MKRTGKPQVNKSIGDIVQNQIGLDPAVRLFESLSKVGGGKFQEAMRRVKRIAQERKSG
jgi:hypothetical protein